MDECKIVYFSQQLPDFNKPNVELVIPRELIEWVDDYSLLKGKIEAGNIDLLIYSAENLNEPDESLAESTFSSLRQLATLNRSGNQHHEIQNLQQLEMIYKQFVETHNSLHTTDVTTFSLGFKSIPGIVGASAPIRRLARLVTRVSTSERPVLITGPTGSGKELVARAIHALSPKKDGPLVEVNCGAIPEHLIESLLFGHEKGSFTGADKRSDGYFHQAAEGCLFLDELAELPLTLQAKLLRVLETGRFRRIGSNKDCKFTGRIIAATHADLKARTLDKSFREDLYYRLNVLELTVPPLDERPEDIPLLVKYFADQQPRAISFTTSAMSYLQRVHWEGNVRELRNMIDRICIFNDDSIIDRSTLHSFLNHKVENTSDELDAIADKILQMEIPDKQAAIQRALIMKAMEFSNNNKSAAARMLGVHRKVVERRLVSLGVSKELETSFSSISH